MFTILDMDEIRKIMFFNRITQSELSKRLGVTQARVSKLLNSKGSVRSETACNIANAIGCKPDRIIIAQKSEFPSTTIAMRFDSLDKRLDTLEKRITSYESMLQR